MRQFLLFRSVLLLSLCRAGWGQRISVGVEGGFPAVDPASSHDARYLVGPTIEFALPAGFAIEVDALFRRTNTVQSYAFFLGTGNSNFVSTVIHGNTWEFPLLGKYYFRRTPFGANPYIATGYAFRTASNKNISTQITSGVDGGQPSTGVFTSEDNGVSVGAIAAVGLKFQANKLSFLPEVRYTRWGDQNSTFTRKNEASLMLGIRF